MTNPYQEQLDQLIQERIQEVRSSLKSEYYKSNPPQPWRTNEIVELTHKDMLAFGVRFEKLIVDDIPHYLTNGWQALHHILSSYSSLNNYHSQLAPITGHSGSQDSQESPEYG